MPRDDAELVALASRGDRSAFATLYRMYERDLYRFAFYLAGGPEAAEELFQETWFRVARRLGGTRIEDFRSWLFAIATNLQRDELRRRRVRRRVIDGAPLEDGRSDLRGVDEAVAERTALRDALARAVEGLTPGQREVFVLVYVEGFKIREVSEITGKPEGTVKSTLHRALGSMRGRLEEFCKGA